MVQIFRDHWERFKESYPHLVTEDIEKNVQKMMECGLFENGYFVYVCTNCGEEKRIAFTCKSRFCLRCSKVYIDNWVNKMRETVFKWIPHRHVILTVPGSLWEYFHSEEMLKMLADSAVMMMKDVISICNKGKKIEPGIMLVIQTAGRASTWNPHIHLLITEGGLDKEGVWHDVSYIDYRTIRKKWMYYLLRGVREVMGVDKRVENIIDEIYTKRGEEGLIIRAKKEKVRKRDIVGYLIKYVASPPIALSRIVEYDFETVTYWYREHPTDRKVKVVVSAYEFIRRMIQHIVLKNFRMVRHYGLYARNKVLKVREVLKRIFEGVRGIAIEFASLLGKVIAPRSYRERMIKSFGMDPFKCSNCGEEMQLWEIWPPKYGTIYYFPDDPR